MAWRIAKRPAEAAGGWEYLLRFAPYADFLCGEGEPVALPEPGVSEGTIRHLLRNQVQPMLASRGGRLVLHASGVAVDEGVVAFGGDSGAGKSTLAAFHGVNGAPVVSDDCLYLDQDLGVSPSPPEVRLWDDSAAALLPDAPATQSPFHDRKFSFHALPRVAETTPRPLIRYYLLERAGGGDIDIRPAEGPELLMALFRSSFLLDTEDEAEMRLQFAARVSLARSGRCFRLRYPAGYEHLPAVRDVIAAHAAGRWHTRERQ